MKLIIYLLIGLLFSSTNMAQETKETEDNSKKATPIVKQKSSASSAILGMSVIGNKESPRSLTIVPWRDPIMDSKTPKIQAVWQPNLDLLDPDSYRREINLFLKHRKQK